MLRALEPAGYAREGGQTPREFARAVPFAGVAELTDLYQRARYGAIELTETEETRVDELLRELKRAARRARLRAR